MSKLIHRKCCENLTYVIEFEYWNPMYTPTPKTWYIARIYKRVNKSPFVPTKVRFAREKGTKPSITELEYLMREYG